MLFELLLTVKHSNKQKKPKEIFSNTLTKQPKMEPTGAISEGEWSSLSGMYTSEDADFMAQLLGNCSLPNQVDSTSNLGAPSNYWPSHESTMNMAGVNEGSFYNLDIANTNLHHFSQGSSSYGGGNSILFPTSSQESYYLSDCHPILINNSSSMSMDFCMGDVTNTTSYLIKGDGCSNQEMSNANVEESGRNMTETAFPDNKNLQPKRESEMPAPDPSVEDKGNNPSENSKKRSRSSGNVSTTTSFTSLSVCYVFIWWCRIFFYRMCPNWFIMHLLILV